MIANPRVSHRLSWWSYPVLLAALAALPCLPDFSQAQESKEQFQNELFVGDIFEVDFDVTDVISFINVDAESKHAEVNIQRAKTYTVADAKDCRTDVRTYKVQRSAHGWVVLAFDKTSQRLVWSTEVELPQPDQAQSGARFLLHTGQGVVTVAAVDDAKHIRLQEIDATTGKVTSECPILRVADATDDSYRRSVTRHFLELMEKNPQLLKEQEANESRLRQFRKLEARERESADQRLRKAVRLEGDLILEEIDTEAAKQKSLSVGQGQSPAMVSDKWLSQLERILRLTNGDAPIEQITMTRDGNMLRIIIEGKAKQPRTIILIDDTGRARVEGALTIEKSTEKPAEKPTDEQGAADTLTLKAIQFLARAQQDQAGDATPPRDTGATLLHLLQQRGAENDPSQDESERE